jgi:uncharacterized protein involved in exopolysaccharide biosynthesis
MENGDQPATKQDIGEVRAEIGEVRAEIGEVRAEIRQTAEQLRSEFQHGFDDLKESLRDVQTELLRAFYSFAQSTDVKLKDGEIADYMLRQRLTAVESRVTDIEKRINFPPQA